jgi:hypothetical protein
MDPELSMICNVPAEAVELPTLNVTLICVDALGERAMAEQEASVPWPKDGRLDETHVGASASPVANQPTTLALVPWAAVVLTMRCTVPFPVDPWILAATVVCTTVMSLDAEAAPDTDAAAGSDGPKPTRPRAAATTIKAMARLPNTYPPLTAGDKNSTDNGPGQSSDLPEPEKRHRTLFSNHLGPCDTLSIMG